MENFFNNNEEVEWVDEEIIVQDNPDTNPMTDLQPPIFEPAPIVEEIAIVESVVENVPADNSEVWIYATRELNVWGVGLIKNGYNTVSKSDYEKLKDIKAIRLARPDEIKKRKELRK